jgi:hypothetical protein
MVFGCDDDAARSRGFGYPTPLGTVQRGRIKDFFLLRAFPPLQVRKRVGSKMHKEIKIIILPVPDHRIRQRPGARSGLAETGRGKRKKGDQAEKIFLHNAVYKGGIEKPI